MQQSENWDSLRYVLAAARAGTLAAAARSLGVNRSTVLRRLREFEAALGVSLFDISPGGFFLTDAGEALMRAAVRIEDEMSAVRRHLDDREHKMTGAVRISTTLPLGYGLLQPYLRRFGEAYPGVELELMATLDGARKVSRHEADVAFRTVVNPKDAMEGERLCGLAVSIYGSQDYIARHGRPGSVEDLADHDMIGREGALGRFAFQEPPPPSHGAGPFRSNTLMFHFAAAKAGIGLASLPCYLADREAGLQRIFAGHKTLPTDLWIMTHAGMKRIARVRIFMAFMAEAIRADRSVIEGYGQAP